MSRLKGVIGLLLLGALSGCQGLGMNMRLQATQDLLTSSGFVAETIKTDPFLMRIHTPARVKLHPVKVLTLYIEGDGFVSSDGRHTSMDPTPKNPVALALATAHPASLGLAVHLARPCHYLRVANGPLCQPRFWDRARYAEEMVQALNQVVDQLVARYQPEQLYLVGFSGGGALAALIATRRDDLSGWVTVAGNLAHNVWTQRQGLAPLKGSLDPLDVAVSLRTQPQVHVVGEEDKVITPHVARAFLHQAQLKADRHLHIIPGQDHACCWMSVWPEMAQHIWRQWQGNRP
ncbi:alpha/beta hydrolase [Magnetococcus sp. PR-3]|uniref:alpha/beta hydrolase n=1 Tax=Magnetococcus sp. PR-3 TaxID=3120355 RepID=UPI002FCE0DEF